MIDSPPMDARLSRRLARLRRMLELDAPTAIIAGECWLVFEAASGGPWRAAWTILESAAWRFLALQVYGPLRCALHRLGWHDQDGPRGRCSACRADDFLRSLEIETADVPGEEAR